MPDPATDAADKAVDATKTAVHTAHELVVNDLAAVKGAVKAVHRWTWIVLGVAAASVAVVLYFLL